MNGQISILIIDDNINFCNALKKCLEKTEGFSVKGIAKDGLDGISKIKTLRPDVIILDIIMPNLDGIGVLERMSMMQFLKKPIVIVLSCVNKDAVIQRAMELGAEYYILKPLNFDMLALRIRQLHDERESAADRTNTAEIDFNARLIEKNNEIFESNAETVITNLIKEMGVTPNVAGYRYLRETIIYMVENGCNGKLYLRGAYKEIADKHNITQENVERSIKCAIDSAYRKTMRNTGDDKANQKNDSHKFSCSQVISILVNRTNTILNEKKANSNA